MDPMKASQWLGEEATATLAWVKGHVSDHAAVSYCITALKKMLTASRAVGDTSSSDPVRAHADLVEKTLDDVTALLRMYPNKEPLWLFRRGLVSLWVDTIGNTNSSMTLQKEAVFDIQGAASEALDGPTAALAGTRFQQQHTDFFRRLVKKKTEIGA